ncbi:MarR family winged helix-turn-helix transcriptional regulator [Streptomyces sp. NPDC059740]|uniref:MarR family winged helix-turn-helix transcriptional regulator n=1 Tax=Streptomyces sp. NPDC059740 TaxID=3346926 RepID=UPI00364F556A
MATPDVTTGTDTYLADQLLRLTRQLHRAQRTRLRPLALTPAQGRLLRTVDRYGDTPPRMTDLAARLEVVPRAVTTLVDALEESGKVSRRPDPANRRVVRIVLTEEGRAALNALRQARRDAAQEVLEPLSGPQRETLAGILSAVVGGETALAGPPSHHEHGDRTA